MVIWLFMIYIVFLSFWLPTYLTLVPLTSLFKALKAVSVDEDTGAGSGGVTGPRSHEYVTWSQGGDPGPVPPRSGTGVTSTRWCLFVTPWTVARQALQFMGFPRQGFWSGLPFPSPGNFPNPGIEPTSPSWQEHSLPLSHQGSLEILCSYK